MCHGTVVIPSGRLLMFSHAVQRISGLSVIAVSEIITGCPQSGLFFIARSLLLPACLLPEVSKSLTVAAISLASTVAASAATIALPAISATVTVAFGPLLHDLLVGCLDLLELFFRLIPIGIVDIGIGMVFPAQCLICFFYFLLGGISAHSQNTVWIISHFPLPLLHCLSSVSSARSHNGTIHRNTEYSAEYPHSVK